MDTIHAIAVKIVRERGLIWAGSASLIDLRTAALAYGATSDDSAICVVLCIWAIVRWEKETGYGAPNN